MMKDIRYNISLYVIIPIIFSGIALLSILLSYNITGFYMRKGADPEGPILLWASLILVLSAVIGLLIVRMLLSPLRKFMEETEKLGVLKSLPENGRSIEKKDEVGRFTQLFEQVSELLTQVEARELFPHIVAQSKSMRGIFRQIMKVAPTDASVLILGETGTGKELISKSIFEHSLRKAKPFMAINCAAIPEGLLESELFGHEKGAFTGANARKIGKFEAASGGTIFLDEIGDMPLETQAKILRVLEEGSVERVGGLKPIPVNVRLIAATNKDLSSMVEAGAFREDLFYRLNVFTIALPPLRDRREDIPVLVDRFLKNSDKPLEVSSSSLQLLSGYPWPGNIRELKNIIEAASVLATDTIEPIHLPSTVTQEWKKAMGSQAKIDLNEDHNLDQKLQEMEKGIIIEALTRAEGIQVKAAKMLGIKERSLWHRLKKYQIDATSFKNG